MSMQKRKGIPSKPRFAQITKRAYELLAELDIGEFPVDPIKIIEHFPSWHLQGWMELRANTNSDDPLNIEKEKAEAKTVKLRDSDKYLIVYDDRTENSQRIRWTLAHEIGHIVLGHLVEFDATALNRRGLSIEDYGVLEVEAHWFAAELLAPKTIISRFNFHDTPKGISLVCDISKAASERRLKQIKQINYGYYASENKILRNFYKHLSQGDFYQVVHDTACRFYPSALYSELSKECRICRMCSSFVTDEAYRFCPVCGVEVVTSDQYSPYKPNKGTFIIGSIADIRSELYLQGKKYYAIPTKESHSLFCPVCKSYESAVSSDKCVTCSTPSVNRCTVEGRLLSEDCRFCPYCGAKAAFKAVYDILLERLTPDNVCIPIDYDDYIICEYWQFIVMTIGIWENAMDLYIALEDSIALYDENDMVVFVRGAKEQNIAIRETRTILTCLTKNGYLPIKRIKVMIAKPVEV